MTGIADTHSPSSRPARRALDDMLLLFSGVGHCNVYGPIRQCSNHSWSNGESCTFRNCFSSFVRHLHLLLLLIHWEFIRATWKFVSGHLSWETWESLHAMAAYGVARAYKEDVVHIAYMSARFMTADPLLNFLLRDASGASLNSLQSRKDVALHRYTKALTDSIGVIASSLVLVSFHRCTPHAAEASVVVQKFCPDPYWHVPWEDQPGTFDIAPDCVNTNLYYTVENALHTNRKQFMQGKPHYCASPKDSHRMVNINKASKTYNSLISVYSV